MNSPAPLTAESFLALYMEEVRKAFLGEPANYEFINVVEGKIIPEGTDNYDFHVQLLRYFRDQNKKDASTLAVALYSSLWKDTNYSIAIETLPIGKVFKQMEKEVMEASIRLGISASPSPHIT
jgi:hypothetical protein